MAETSTAVTETVTLSEAKALIHAMAHDQSIRLLSPPGLGKSQLVQQAAAEAGLACRSLLGTQIAPEDVSGIPRIVGERSVFCPPRILLPEHPEPFCLFLDELPACTPDVQKAFYSLLLERRIGEHLLPAGAWVVSAGNRIEDRALVRALSSESRVHPAGARRRAGVADLGAGRRHSSRHPGLHHLHAGGADAPGPARAGAVLDAASLGLPVGRAAACRAGRHLRPGAAPRAGVRAGQRGRRRRVLRHGGGEPRRSLSAAHLHPRSGPVA